MNEEKSGSKGLNNPLSDMIKPYQNKIEEALKLQVTNFGEKTPLRDACEYALLNGGKRFRPIIVLMMANALNKNADVLLASLAVEYFHTASLIADDLPCMDDDALRRNKPTLHKVFGEPIALLASYALISHGYEAITRCGDQLSKSHLPFSKDAEKIVLLAVQNASYNTGLLGATGGQYLDMFPKNISLEVIEDVILKKTVSLFEISFVFGFLFGGGDLSLLPEVKNAAKHFGMAFQIADDIDDIEQDLKNGHQVNMAVNIGREAAENRVKEELFYFFESLEKLNVNADEFKTLIYSLINKN